jgi:FtsZ-binding cell division protein ZapB
MDAKLLQKIEELTLYVIELKEENEEMRAEDKTKEKAIEALNAKDKEIEELKAMVKALLLDKE